MFRSGALCKFANVRNRAVQFFARQEIFIARKQAFANHHCRPDGDQQENRNEGTFPAYPDRRSSLDGIANTELLMVLMGDRFVACC